MTNSITPPPELINQWRLDWEALRPQGIPCQFEYVAIRASQRGADMELEECCEWLVRNYNYPEAGNPLRAARRPQPPSLKEQALAALREAYEMANDRPPEGISNDQIDIIRRALKALDD